MGTTVPRFQGKAILRMTLNTQAEAKQYRIKNGSKEALSHFHLM